MMRLGFSALPLILGLALPNLSWSFDEKDPLLVSASTSPTDWSPGQAGRLELEVSLPPGYHGYEDQLKLTLLEPEGFHLGPPTITPLVSFFDKFSKKNRNGFKDKAGITAGIQAPLEFQGPARKMRIELVYQACSETFCLFPTTKQIEIPVTLIGAEKEIVQDEPSVDKPSPFPLFRSTEFIVQLISSNLILAFALTFLAGVLTSFTPCIFPMIPITLAVIGHEADKRTRAQNFLLSLLYVHGIATTYALLGLAAASSGALFGASLGNPWVLGTLCVLFLAMALGMYGVYELQVPAFIRQSLGTKKTNAGYIGAFVSGLIAGVVASPCVGPVLVALLAWVSTSGSQLLGFFLLFTYAMGLGLIFLILGAFTELTRLLPRSGPWLEMMKFVLGSLMLGVFYYYLSFLISPRAMDFALGAGLLVLGLALRPFRILGARPSSQARLSRAMAQALAIVGVFFFASGLLELRSGPKPHELSAAATDASPAGWETYTEEKYLAALASGKPTLVDFWAEWCAACFELEEKTFSRPEVRERLMGFNLLRFDATKDSDTLRVLKGRWKIQGLPSVIFIDSNGKWNPALTLTEYENPRTFLQRIDLLSPKK